MTIPALTLVFRCLSSFPLLLAPLVVLAAAPSKAAASAAAKTTSKAAAKPAAPLPPPPLPVALYLTWQRDPVTTMTVHWHTDWTEGFADTLLEYRAAGADDTSWKRAMGRAEAMPFTTRFVHTVELTQLRGDTIYEFRLGRLATREADGEMLFTPHESVQKFRTLPATLSRPVRFVSGGDIYNIDLLELTINMCRVAAARDPEFAIIGGDLAYANDEPKAVSRWFDFFRIWRQTMVTKDGLIIPLVVTIGNHEAHGDTYLIRGGSPNRGLATERAMVYYTVFSFPGRPGYKALDFGNYLSIIAMDSAHTTPVAGAQTDWLRAMLAQRRAIPWIVPVYHVPA